MMARNSFSIPDKKIYLKKANLFKKTHKNISGLIEFGCLRLRPLLRLDRYGESIDNQKHTQRYGKKRKKRSSQQPFISLRIIFGSTIYIAQA